MNKRALRALDDFEAEVRAHLAAGHQAFVVSIYLMPATSAFSGSGTTRYKFAAMEEAAQQRLLDMGLAVHGLDRRDWEYKTFFEVQVPQARALEKQCPMCAETIKAAALICRYCHSEVSDTVPATTGVVPNCGSAPITFDTEYSTDDEGGDREVPREHVGTLMCPRVTCDEAGLRTNDDRCGRCATPTVPWE